MSDEVAKMAVDTARPVTLKEVPGSPLLGNFMDFRRDRLALFRRTFAECGDLGVYRLGPRKFYFVNSAPLAQEVLIKNGSVFDKTAGFRAFARPLLGDGLLTARNEVHTAQRRLIQPKFHKAPVARSALVSVENAHRMADAWTDGAIVDVRREMVRLVLWIVGKNLFSRDVLDEADDLGGALTDAIHGFDSMASAFLPLTIEWPTPKNLRYRRAIERLEATFYRLLRERQASTERPDDWLTLLMECRHENGDPMTDKELRDEALNMFMPGHETTATGLTWAFQLLATHPEVYRRLREEVDTVLGGRTATLDDVPNLPLALQVFKEALRLYPPVYMFTRQSAEDVTIGGHHIKAGSQLVFSPYAMHRRPDYFPDPDRFDPDRFTPEREAALPRLTYMPFGAGHRICIGNHHALLSGQMIIASLAQRVEFETLTRVVGTQPQVTLRPRGGIPMRVRRRPPASVYAGGQDTARAATTDERAPAGAASADDRAPVAAAAGQSTATGCPYSG